MVSLADGCSRQPYTNDTNQKNCVVRSFFASSQAVYSFLFDMHSKNQHFKHHTEAGFGFESIENFKNANAHIADLFRIANDFPFDLLNGNTNGKSAQYRARNAFDTLIVRLKPAACAKTRIQSYKRINVQSLCRTLAIFFGLCNVSLQTENLME